LAWATDTVTLPTGTWGDTVAGVPTVIGDGSVTLPLTVSGGAHSPGQSLDLLWLRPSGIVDVYPVDRDPSGFFGSFSVRPHKAVPNGLGGVLVAYDAHYYFASPHDEARVRLVNVDGSLGGGGSWGGTNQISSWYGAGRLVLGEDRVRATSYRFGSQGTQIRVSDISLEGYGMGDFFVEGNQPPRFTALQGGEFFQSYPDGTTWGPHPDHETVQLANAIEAGAGRFIGTAAGALTMRLASPLTLASSLWPFSFGGEQAQNAPRQLCGSCQKNYRPPEGHGAITATDNRRVLTVVVDSSWYVSGIPDPRIWDAMICAMNKWNNTTDAWGNKTGFYFVEDQLRNYEGEPDLTIVKGMHPLAPIATLGAIFPPGPDNRAPSTLYLTAGNVTSPFINDGDRCGRIAHEFGHKLGAASMGNCPHLWTVMSGTNLNGSRDVDSVTALDVELVNQAFVYPGSCIGVAETGEPRRR